MGQFLLVSYSTLIQFLFFINSCSIIWPKIHFLIPLIHVVCFYFVLLSLFSTLDDRNGPFRTSSKFGTKILSLFYLRLPPNSCLRPTFDSKFIINNSAIIWLITFSIPNIPSDLRSLSNMWLRPGVNVKESVLLWR